MKTAGMLLVTLVWLAFVEVRAQQGLKGDYYNGTNFERKILTRVDPQLNFRWVERSPAAGVNRSYYSVRWTGKLLAPASGRYTFYAKVDDGIRIWVGNRKVMDAWHLNDSRHFVGTVTLQAGQYYDLRVDYFNDMNGGVIELYWQRPDEKKDPGSLVNVPGTPIPAQFFRQTAPPVAARPIPTPQKVPPVAAAKPAVNIKPSTERPKPKVLVRTLPAPKPVVRKQPVIDTVTVPVALPKPTAKPTDEFVAGETFVLRHVQFQQSSYVLLPESSAELNNVVQALLRNPQWRIEVAGHTDNVGDPRLNMALSENRAKVVAHYLRSHGIADERIAPKGYGCTRPIADNTVESERPRNRRVEITLR